MKQASTQFLQSLKFPIVLIIILWAIHIYQFVSEVSLGHLGIYPKHFSGLKGIITSPLIHGDFNHLISNTFPLFMLTVTINFFYRKTAFISFILIYVMTGVVVWIFARPVYHIGASGVVYGLLSFVFWTGIFRRNLKSIVLSLVVTILYSGYIWGVLPIKQGVSWESHLYGAIVGIVIAYIFRKNIEEDETKKVYDWELEEQEEGQYFLDRNTFDSKRF